MTTDPLSRAILNSDAFKQWDSAVLDKAIALKNQVAEGEIILKQMTPEYFISQMPKLEDFLAS